MSVRNACRITPRWRGKARRSLRSGYFATRSGNSYSYTFNWQSAYVLYVVYLGSATVVPQSLVVTAANPTVTLLSL